MSIGEEQRRRNKVDEIMLFMIQLSHWIMLITVIVSVPLLLILEPFYVSIPICSWIMHLTFNDRLRCPCTDWENYYRRKTGRKQIGGFIGHNLKILGLKKKRNK